ncbi:MAG: hypothetical protein ACRD32_09035, partial [Nitrososphaerales archaeon]
TITYPASAVSGVSVVFNNITNNGGGTFTVESTITATIEPGDTLMGIFSTVNAVLANFINPVGVTIPTGTSFVAAATDIVSGNLGDTYCVESVIHTGLGDIHTSTCTDLNQNANGTVSVTNTNCLIDWQAINAEVVGASMDPLAPTLSVNINTVANGAVHLRIPRAGLDSVLGGVDQAFLVFVDGAGASYTEPMTTPTDRTLQIPVAFGSVTVEIIGNVSGTCGEEGRIIVTGPGQESIQGTTPFEGSLDRCAPIGPRISDMTATLSGPDDMVLVHGGLCYHPDPEEEKKCNHGIVCGPNALPSYTIRLPGANPQTEPEVPPIEIVSLDLRSVNPITVG